MRMVAGDFDVEEAAKLSKVDAGKLEVWERTGFLRASVPAKRRGVSRRYTFRDVVALRVAGELRAAGVSLQMLRKVVAYLRARDGLSATDALARTNLVTSGEQVYEVAGEVTLHVPSGQRMMVHVTIPLDQVVSEVQRRARTLRRAA
jgi:DNA-binding transcriptional MerR regulator